MTWALGIAATQAAGLREMFGSMCKSLHGGTRGTERLERSTARAQRFYEFRVRD
jgi:hypothetical protein